MHGWDEHTGELQLWVTAPTEPEVFGEALRAVAEILSENGPPAAPGRELREIALEAGDRGVLLADWIGELAFLAETDAFVPDSLEALELAGKGLRARVRGHFGRPPHLVKAVTYHDLRFERTDDGWRAQVVLDV
ncbi:MAG TPA: archease [Solirubrobacteraceae bacterium]|nr:archease [Solirubrobacteraceae bacterium]